MVHNIGHGTYSAWQETDTVVFSEKIAASAKNRKCGQNGGFKKLNLNFFKLLHVVDLDNSDCF